MEILGSARSGVNASGQWFGELVVEGFWELPCWLLQEAAAAAVNV